MKNIQSLKILVATVFLMVQHVANSQINLAINGAGVKALKPLFFSMNNADALLSTQVIPNAFEINLKIEEQQVLVHAQVQVTGPGSQQFEHLFDLQLASSNASKAKIVSDQGLSTVIPRTIIIHPGSKEGVQHYYFIYNLLLKPSVEAITPGNYDFSLLFTFTQQ